MTSANRRAGPLVPCAILSVLLVTLACVPTPPLPVKMRPPAYAQLLREATDDYAYTSAGATVDVTSSAIGKFGAVTGVTIQAYSATRTSGGNGNPRKVVARFDLTGGDYPRLGMHVGKNYVFLDHDNEHSQGAIMTRAYFVVSETSPDMHYLIVDKRINALPGAHAAPVAVVADPPQGLVFGGCVEGSFCPDNHCTVTDAGDAF